MDPYVIRAMARWPDVPAVHGWLSLNRRGDWLIKGERLGHRKAVAFINRNYAADGRGRWYFQNGPQRVYVGLEYTPWVYRLSAAGGLVTHTDRAVDDLNGAYLDDEGSLLLLASPGIGVVDDRDLDALSDCLRLEDGGSDPARIEAAAATIQAGGGAGLVLDWRGRSLDVGRVKRAETAARFGFDPDPAGWSGD